MRTTADNTPSAPQPVKKRAPINRKPAMKLWKTDAELFAAVQQELFTCVVGDVMDKMRLRHQFLPPHIRPLRSDMVVIGRAMPVLSVDVFEEQIAGTANPLMAKSFGSLLEALSRVRMAPDLIELF